MRDNFRTFDLNLLRVFDALMAEGNVTRTAQRLSLTQPAVSNALGRLRSTFGNTLFVKTLAGVSPTPTARELWSLIGPHFERLREAISPTTFDPSTFSGSVTVAMSDYTVERILPGLLAYLCEHAPRLRITQTQYSVANLSTMFDKEGIDFAIGAYLNDTSQTNGIRTHALWPIHSSCLMRKDHPLVEQPLTLDKFLNARHVDVLLPGMYMPLYDNLLAGHGLQRNLVLKLSYYSQALAVIHQSDCIGVLPTSLLDLSPLAPDLVSVEHPIPMPVRPLGIMWHQRSDADPMQAWLRTTISAMFAQTSASRKSLRSDAASTKKAGRRSGSGQLARAAASRGEVSG